jgi:hypothetical protein
MMHGILVLPLLAWLLSFADWPERRRLGVVLLGAAGYTLMAGVVAVGNVASVSSSNIPLASSAFAGLGAVGLLAAGLLAVNGVAGASHASGIEHD